MPHRLEAPERIYLRRAYPRGTQRSRLYRSREDGAYYSADPRDIRELELLLRDERVPGYRRASENEPSSLLPARWDVTGAQRSSCWESHGPSASGTHKCTMRFASNPPF